MYSMVCTRPDLAYAISLLSRLMSNPSREHWFAIKWFLRYISSLTNVGFLYKKNNEAITVEGFVGSDFAGDKDTRKSTVYFFIVCENCVS